jgi:hypothetical protein
VSSAASLLLYGPAAFADSLKPAVNVFVLEECAKLVEAAHPEGWPVYLSNEKGPAHVVCDDSKSGALIGHGQVNIIESQKG